MKITKSIPTVLLTATNSLLASDNSIAKKIIVKKPFFQNNKIAILIGIGCIVAGSVAYYLWSRKKNN